MAARRTGYTLAVAVNSSDHTVHVPVVVVRHMDSDSAAAIAVAGESSSAPGQRVGRTHSPVVVASRSRLDCIAVWDFGRSRSVGDIGWDIAGSGPVACWRCGAERSLVRTWSLTLKGQILTMT